MSRKWRILQTPTTDGDLEPMFLIQSRNINIYNHFCGYWEYEQGPHGYLVFNTVASCKAYIEKRESLQALSDKAASRDLNNCGIIEV